MIPKNYPVKARGILEPISPGRRHWSLVRGTRATVPSPFAGVPPRSIRMAPDEAARTIGARGKGTITEFLENKRSPQNIRTNEPPHPSTAPYPPSVGHEIETRQGTGRTEDISVQKAASDALLSGAAGLFVL